MKNAIILVFALLSLNLAWGQSKKVYFGVQLTPETSLISTSGSIQDNQSRPISTGFSVGLVGRYYVSNTFSFEGGLVLRDRSFKSQINDLIFPDQIDPRTGLLTNSGSVSIQDNIKSSLLSVPITANIHFKNGWTAHAGIGIDRVLKMRRYRTQFNKDGELALALFDETDGTIHPISGIIGLSKTVYIKNFLVEFGPKMNLNWHRIDFPIGVESKLQASLGFHLSLML